MMQSLRCFVREAVIGLYRARGMNALTVGIIAASLAIVGGFALLMENLSALADDWNRVQVHAYLKDDAVDNHRGRIDRLVEELRARPIVREVRFISREEALAIFRETFSELTGATDALGTNPFPASLEIAVMGERDERLESTERLLADLEASPLVEIVQDNEKDARRLIRLTTIVSRVGLGVGGVLAAASTFIIFNVIRLTIHARRDEISIMRLVGATPGFIRGPFLVEGMLQGLLGAALALAALWATHLALADYAARSGSGLAELLSDRFLPTWRGLQLVAGGLLIGLIGSALSLRRFLAEETAAR